MNNLILSILGVLIFFTFSHLSVGEVFKDESSKKACADAYLLKSKEILKNKKEKAKITSDNLIFGAQTIGYFLVNENEIVKSKLYKSVSNFLTGENESRYLAEVLINSSMIINPSSWESFTRPRLNKYELEYIRGATDDRWSNFSEDPQIEISINDKVQKLKTHLYENISTLCDEQVEVLKPQQLLIFISEALD